MQRARKIEVEPARVDRFITDVLVRAALSRERDHMAEQAAAQAAEELEAEGQAPDVDACRESFVEWLRWWPFKNRETGEVLTFASMWTGQRDLAEIMMANPWVFALKAGKLGFTEEECAWDGWIARFKPNSRVHIYSKEAESAKLILSFVRFGLQNIHHALRLPMKAGTKVLELQADPLDIRTIAAYPSNSSKGTPGIDQTATHVHLDELSHVEDPETLYSDASTIVPPGGSLHVVTRGRGEGVYTKELWDMCHNNGGGSKLFGFFADWRQRPDRDEDWYHAEADNRPHLGMMYFAPRTPDEALAGDMESVYIPPDVWAACRAELPELTLTEPIIIAADAGVTHDLYAVVAVSLDPSNDQHIAIRAVRTWAPDPATGRIDYSKPEGFIKFIATGGCPLGHAEGEEWQDPDCPECTAGNFTFPAHNVIQFTYDKYQLESFSQHMKAAGVCWVDEFDQGTERLVGDANMALLARQRRLVHPGDPQLDAAVANAKAKMPSGEDTKIRMIKRHEKGKIDAAVAAAMGVKRVGDILIGQGGMVAVPVRAR